MCNIFFRCLEMLCPQFWEPKTGEEMNCSCGDKNFNLLQFNSHILISGGVFHRVNAISADHRVRVKLNPWFLCWTQIYKVFHPGKSVLWEANLLRGQSLVGWRRTWSWSWRQSWSSSSPTSSSREASPSSPTRSIPLKVKMTVAAILIAMVTPTTFNVLLLFCQTSKKEKICSVPICIL